MVEVLERFGKFGVLLVKAVDVGFEFLGLSFYLVELFGGLCEISASLHILFALCTVVELLFDL